MARPEKIDLISITGDEVCATPVVGTVADLSEDGIALAFAERYESKARYCHTTGAWYTWSGTHWKRDDSMLAFCWARDLCREINRSGSWALKKISTAAAVERAARSDRRLAVTSELWDSNPFLLGTPSGVVDLRTGEMRPAMPGDFITRLTSVAPGNSAEPPLWMKFLHECVFHAMVNGVSTGW